MATIDETAARQLSDVRQWAKEKIDAGHEPPWAWFQYMKLIETADAILSASNCATTTESSRQSEPQTDGHLRLVAATCPRENALHHPAGLPVQMPM